MKTCQNCRLEITGQALSVLVTEIPFVPVRETWCVPCWDAAKLRGDDLNGQGSIVRGDGQVQVRLAP